MLQLEDQPSKPIGKGSLAITNLNFDAMVEMHFMHQTWQAAISVHTKLGNEKPKDTICKKIIHHLLHKILKEEQNDLAVGTGFEHWAHWISAKGGQASNSSPAARNMANTVTTATAHAAKVNAAK